MTRPIVGPIPLAAKLCELLQGEPYFYASFQPRQTYCGRPLRPEILKHTGSVVKVRIFWRMNDGDLYPGEWAVGSAFDDEPELFGRTWIASGDLALFKLRENHSIPYLQILAFGEQ